jgi:hypothetical protein
MDRRKTWMLTSAVLVASLQPLSAYLVLAMDDRSIDPPTLVVAIVAYAWFLLSLPAGLFAGRGFVVTAVLVAFWGGVGAWIGGALWEQRRRRLRRLTREGEKPPHEFPSE